MVGLGIALFVCIWAGIIYEMKNAPLLDENMNIWEKPIIIKENLFEHNGRTWEHLYDHPRGYTLRVFNDDMTKYEYKEKID